MAHGVGLKTQRDSGASRTTTTTTTTSLVVAEVRLKFQVRLEVRSPSTLEVKYISTPPRSAVITETG